MSATFARFKRSGLKGLVENEYDLKVLAMSESERGIVLITDNGVKRLIPTKEPQGKLHFSAAACEHLYNNGFTSVGMIYPTCRGDWSVSHEKTSYILQSHIQGNVFEPKSAGEAAVLGNTLARLHMTAAGFVPPPGSQSRVDWGRWMDKYKCSGVRMKRFLEGIEEKGEMSRFDREYKKCGSIFHDRFLEAYCLMKNHGYLDKVRQAMKNNQLVHKAFKRHNLLVDSNGQLFVTGMEQCGFDIPEYDIATMLESFTGKNKTELAGAALVGYMELIPLDGDSIRIIQAFLLEPDRYYKVINRYYGKKKNDTEQELLHKLERSVRKECRKDEIIMLLKTWEGKAG